MTNKGKRPHTAKPEDQLIFKFYVKPNAEKRPEDKYIFKFYVNSKIKKTSNRHTSTSFAAPVAENNAADSAVQVRTQVSVNTSAASNLSVSTTTTKTMNAHAPANTLPRQAKDQASHKARHNNPSFRTQAETSNTRGKRTELRMEDLVHRQNHPGNYLEPDRLHYLSRGFFQHRTAQQANQAENPSNLSNSCK